MPRFVSVATILLAVSAFSVNSTAFAQQPEPSGPAAPSVEPLVVAAPTPVAPYNPLPSLPAAPLDERYNRIGIAQTIARERNLQARMLWVDATANLDRINSEDKIRVLIQRAKSAGFNTIVVDGKPIIGFTIYPSKFAPKLTEWSKPGYMASMPAEFDPLAVFARLCEDNDLKLLVGMNAFSEGHRDMQKGLAYQNPSWQSVLYEEQPSLRVVGGEGGERPLAPRINEIDTDPEILTVYTEVARLNADLAKPARAGRRMVAFFDNSGQVIAQALPETISRLSLEIPAGGAAIVASSDISSDWLARTATVGQRFVVTSKPIYVPIGQRPKRQVPVMTNPHSPVVRQRILDMIRECVTNYDVDGVIFDDRLRYAGIDADFSPEARDAFEKYVGKSVRWPDDVYRVRYGGGVTLSRVSVPGPLWDAWITFRALTIRNWVAEAAATVRQARPNAIFATYVGSWYPDYPDIGANWASDSLSAGLRFLTPEYAKTGWASLTDLIVTGCYYRLPTIYEAASTGQNIGNTIEAAGQFSNRVTDDASWCVAGIMLSDFADRPRDLERALQAACASSQGVMVFDLSHNIDPMWPVFTRAFSTPAKAPFGDSAALAEVRKRKAESRARGEVPPPVILYRGASGTGF